MMKLNSDKMKAEQEKTDAIEAKENAERKVKDENKKMREKIASRDAKIEGSMIIILLHLPLS